METVLHVLYDLSWFWSYGQCSSTGLSRTRWSGLWDGLYLTHLSPGLILRCWTSPAAPRRSLQPGSSAPRTCRLRNNETLWTEPLSPTSATFLSILQFSVLARRSAAANQMCSSISDVIDFFSSNDVINSLHVFFTATSAGNECLISDKINTLC